MLFWISFAIVCIMLGFVWIWAIVVRFGVDYLWILVFELVCLVIGWLFAVCLNCCLMFWFGFKC